MNHAGPAGRRPVVAAAVSTSRSSRRRTAIWRRWPRSTASRSRTASAPSRTRYRTPPRSAAGSPRSPRGPAGLCRRGRRGRLLGFCWARPFRAARRLSAARSRTRSTSPATRAAMASAAALLEALIDACTGLGCRQMIAVVGDAATCPRSGCTEPGIQGRRRAARGRGEAGR